MRVTSDRQTLILAGETPPPRTGSAAGSGAQAAESGTQAAYPGAQRVTIISARVDAVVAHGIYTPSPAPASSGAALPDYHASLPAPPPELYQAYVVANPRSSSTAADAYTRTRDLAPTNHLIDTYA